MPEHVAATRDGGHAALRRLIAAALTLVIIDLFVPSWVARVERARYEGTDVFRFAYSDLFGIGPAVEYLRDNPRGDRPRAVFLGNSVVWGYRLTVEDSLPVQFQRLEPSVRVFNFAVNGFGIASAYLMVKAMIDSIDVVYVHADGAQVNAGLSRMIPVSDEDIRRYGLEPPDRVEQWLERRLSVWQLYGSSYRLQAALFGTSTRNYLYTHKAVLIGGAASSDPPAGYAASPPSSNPLAVQHAVAPASSVDEQALAAAEPWLWDFATSIRAHGKRAVFWRLAPGGGGSSAEWDQLNRVFRGSAVFATIGVPQEMMIDERHLSARGSALLAGVIRDLTRAEFPATVAVH